ncbi:hemolysin family protein [Nakamurella leprariae]|uniref:HlyC/CorC family transporter n=1 Tax=Nakamurella leprariae TaxID=2803911 RepID=A0A938Y667_9ACTN|nr:hemolysin family protein [Nakamurella leprariae]MBM9466771.1 HlyC/CorC family transporter [Nakamurella leprariae]
MTGSWLLLLLVVVLLMASAFFVAAEFSLISARRSVIEPLAVSSARARSTLRAMEQVSVMMATAQLGITLCGVLLGALGEPAVASLLEPVFHDLGVPDAWLHPVALTIALLLVVSAHVALGEMVPKNIAIAGPERTAMMLAPPLQAVATAIGPVVRGLNHLANAVVRLTGREPRDEVASAFTREEVADLVAQSHTEGLLDAEEHQLITSALDLDTAPVTSVLVPDEAVVSVPVGVTPAEVERACQRTGFSRFPIRREDGRFIGYLHIRDVVGLEDVRDLPVPPEAIRPLPVLTADTDLRTALDRMRRQGAHMAQVRSADTGPTEPRPGQVAPGAGEQTIEPDRRRGLVMLEDVIETLIGEIRDATRRSPYPVPSSTRRPQA